MAESDKKAHRPWQNIAMGNITRVKQINFNDRTDPHYDSNGDFTDENGFFIRSSSGGIIKYCPVGNEDSEAITKTIDASAYFIDPEICRKLFKLVTSPDTDIYIGYGV